MLSPNYRPECQVDPWPFDQLGWRKAVQPIRLGFACHHEQASVLEHQFHFLGGFFVFEGKFPLGSKTYRTDRAVFFEVCFPVAVPGHAFLSGMVEVEQAGIKSLSGFLFDGFF